MNAQARFDATLDDLLETLWDKRHTIVSQNELQEGVFDRIVRSVARRHVLPEQEIAALGALAYEQRPWGDEDDATTFVKKERQ